MANIADKLPAMDVRESIRDALKQQGRSVYWLAKEMRTRGVCGEQHVYRYMRGEQDVTGKIIGEMLDALRVELRGER